ncbi:receptor-like kinase TMK4, partial [Tanacetum coccineum]
DNQLTGLVPDSVMSLPKLAKISLTNNLLQGPLPVFRRSVKVESGVSNNGFCSDKPGKCDVQVTALLEVAGALGYPLSLAETWFGDDACDGWKFVVCDLNNSVTQVIFAKQDFSGTISPAFGNLTSLRTLSLN